MKPNKLPIIENGPRDSLIQWLEETLEHAKSGELQGIAAACEWKDGSVTNGWSLSNRQNMRMIGSLDMLKSIIIEMML